VSRPPTRTGNSTPASLAVLLVPLFLGCSSDPSAPAYVASASCPLKSPAAWQAFLEQATDDPHWVKTCSDLNDCSTTVGEFASHVTDDVQSVFSLCSADIARNPTIDRCSANLRRFVPAWLAQHSPTAYGFSLDNSDYFLAQTAVNEPTAMMDPPPGLLSVLPLRSSIEQLAVDNGWAYLTHDSCLGGVRTFIMKKDPLDRFDQWFLFGLDADGKQIDSPSIMSFIAVQKKDAQGQYLPKVRLHFRDYLVTQTPSGWTLELPADFPGKCYACHVSGTRRLLSTLSGVVSSSPVRGEPGFGLPTPLAFGESRLADLNQRLDAYGVPDWDETIDPAAHGPALGSDLGCTHCHDGELRGMLTVSTSEGTLGQKIVDQLSMQAATAADRVVPDAPAMALLERSKLGDPTLSSAERIQLDAARARHVADYEALAASRFPTWRAWALTSKCED